MVGGELGAVEVRQLVGMELHRQAMPGRGGKDPRRLLGEKAMPSQKASTASARPWRAMEGIILWQTSSR